MSAALSSQEKHREHWSSSWAPVRLPVWTSAIHHRQQLTHWARAGAGNMNIGYSGTPSLQNPFLKVKVLRYDHFAFLSVSLFPHQSGSMKHTPVPSAFNVSLFQNVYLSYDTRTMTLGHLTPSWVNFWFYLCQKMNLSGFVMKVLGMKMYLKNNNLTFPLAKLILLSPSCIENNLFHSMIYDMIRLLFSF